MFYENFPTVILYKVFLFVILSILPYVKIAKDNISFEIFKNFHRIWIIFSIILVYIANPVFMKLRFKILKNVSAKFVVIFYYYLLLFFVDFILFVKLAQLHISVGYHPVNISGNKSEDGFSVKDGAQFSNLPIERQWLADQLYDLAFPIWDASGEIIDENPIVQPCFRTQSCAQDGVRAC